MTDSGHTIHSKHYALVGARILACLASILTITFVLGLQPDFRGRLFFAGTSFLFIVFLLSLVWGLRYAIFTSLIAGVGFAWLSPPTWSLRVDEPIDMFALVAFLAMGILGSRVSERIRREGAIAEQRRRDAVAAQERFRDVVNSVEGIVWEADAETCKFSFVSDQAERVLGYPVEQWLKEPNFWRDHIHPEDRDGAVSYCQQATREQRNHDIEYRMIAAGGEAVWVRNLITVVVANGRSVELRGVIVDITERKRKEEALREQADLLNLTHDAIFVRDMAEKITYWNRGAEERYGWTADEAIGKVSHTLLKTIFPQPLERITMDLVRTGHWEGELTHTKKFGTPVVVASRWAVQRDAQGTPIAVLEINNDITQRKRAEDALRQSEWNLAEAQRLTQTGSFVWDLKTREESYVSDEWYRIWDLEPSAQGRFSLEKLTDRIHPDDRRLWETAIQQAIARKSDYELEYRALLPNKPVKHLHVIGHPIFNAEGEVVQFMGTVSDITERKRAERERERLRQLETDLAHMNRVTTMGELTASLAHEINQPIAAAMTNASTCVRWLTAENPNIEEARAAAGRILKDTDRAAQIIRRLRSLFKKGGARREAVDVNTLIDEIDVLLRSEADRHCVSIRKELASDLSAVNGDRVQLQQVLMNLMMNSIDAMKEMDPFEKRELVLKSRRDGTEQLVISVTDTGRGLPPDPARIFDAFFTTKTDGTGMGLAISRTIIEAHGGRLWATPNPQGGATFSFTLPLNLDA